MRDFRRSLSSSLTALGGVRQDLIGSGGEAVWPGIITVEDRARVLARMQA